MHTSFFAASAALLSLASFVQAIPQAITGSVVTVSRAPAATSTVACNNSPELCNRNYNNITYMGAHDAPFLRDSSTGFSTSGNQFYNATKALSAGLRLIQGQVHNLNGTLELCHTTCNLLDGGSLESFLVEIRRWMDSNPNEVVTLLLVNSDNQDASTFGSAFQASGISKYGYTPTTTGGPMATWPTLQTLITANTRLVTFIASITYNPTYPYLLSEFDFVFETAFGVTSQTGFNCTLDRPSSLSSSTAAISAGYMGLLNHFLDSTLGFGITVPDVSNIVITNSPNTTTTGAVGVQGAQCASQWGNKPTFILVDFFNVGPSIQTADNLNGITATGRTSISTAALTAGSSSAGTRRDANVWLGIAGLSLGVVAVGNFVWL